MSFGAWLHPPRHLLVLFLVVTLAPAAGLVWLGWQLLRQDRALSEQRVRERRERAADLLVAALEQRLLVLERDLARPSALRDARPGEDAVFLLLGPGGVEAIPSSRLLYYPFVPPCRDEPASIFRAGEEQEFRLANPAAAAAVFRDLARSPDATVRAGAYLRLARNLRKAGRMNAALDAYRELARLGPVPVDCTPADLVARRARCVVLAELGRAELRAEAASLLADLRGGRWRLDRATYQVHAEDVRGWTGVDPTGDRENLALSIGAEWLWDRWQAAARGEGRGQGRHSMEVSPEGGSRKAAAGGSDMAGGRREAGGGENEQGRGRHEGSEGRLVTILWNASDEGLVGLVAGPDHVEREWLSGLRAILSSEGVRVALRGRDERPAPGPGPASVPRWAVRRAAADTGLPWTVVVTSAEPAADLAEPPGRRRLLLWGLTLLVILVSAGTYFTARAFLRELAAARLQSDFVAAVSHEFRTPLASLRQFTENLLDGRVPTEERRLVYYSAQSRATERLHRLVEGLLDFGRMEAGDVGYRFEPVDAGELARSVVEDFRQDLATAAVTSDPSTRSGRAHELELAVQDGLPLVRGDREALGRALWNLLDNAVKYSPGCPAVWVDVTHEQGQVAFRVRDTGLGIPRDEQRQVSRKFFRGSAAKTTGVKGTGIGLAMVQHIVHAHRGRVRVESAVGTGSTFTIVLPEAPGRGQ